MASPRQVAVYVKGTEVIFETASQWTVAGMIQHTDGHWWLAANGHSTDSVLQRTGRRYRYCPDAVSFEVADIHETTAPVVREYFGTHAVITASVFTPEEGWQPLHMPASRKAIRALAKERGVTAIAFKASGRQADFQMDELLASIRPRKASK